MTGSITCVGLGPGKQSEMTGLATAAIMQSDVIAGYTTYVKIVEPLLLDNQRVIATGMRSEIDRCKAAIAEARKGSAVSMVCSGDAGVYGMAGLIMELASKEEHEAEEAGSPLEPLPISVVPGVTAAVSGAARLGAPLMQDFAVISLSDLLVSWDVIEQRLKGAAAGDFVTVLYNPGSKRRVDNIKRACDILLGSRGPETVCGIVDNIGRDGESARLLTLGELRDTKVEMFSTVFIGNSRTRNIDGRMVTLRGYEQKE
jgi:precorrin-3B C17-methyltransferase